MATPQENAQAIITHAATLDTMIALFRTIRADIDAREAEIRKAFPGRVLAKSGQQRLADYAHAQMVIVWRPGCRARRAAAQKEAEGTIF
jgi:hypothetical protein